MKCPSLPKDELERLEELYDYQILDTDSEQAFDDISLLATQICQVPMALISLVDAERQWFKARIGLEVCETPRDISFCGHAILGDDEVFVVEDAEQDERFSGNPLVTGGPRIRFYAGAPLITPQGKRIGTLCALDHKPRTLDAAQRQGLVALARQVVALLELRRKSDQLESRDRRRSRLFSVVSHDLRTAFTGLIGYVGVLSEEAEELEPAAIRRMAERAGEQAREALRMAEDLLAWARSEMGSLQFNPVKLNVGDRIERCVDLLQRLAEAKDITMEAKFESDLEMMADDTLLTSILRNLIANGIKFSPPGGSVRIRSRAEGDDVVFKVRDSGPGIDAQQVEALEQGEALETTPGTRGEKGAGLGLLLTHQFVKRHGGSMSFDSDEGTTVTLRLPRQPRL